MEMYTDELIPEEELNEQMGGIRRLIRRLPSRRGRLWTSISPSDISGAGWRRGKNTDMWHE